MKTFVLSFLFLPSFLFSQAVDSAAIKQVDSLIQIARTLSGQRQFEQALETMAVAESAALEKFGRESAEYGRCCSYRGRICLMMGNFPEAEKRLLESIGILERVVGREHSEYA
jgi:hypothetical protein